LRSWHDVERTKYEKNQQNVKITEKRSIEKVGGGNIISHSLHILVIKGN
jgi:hypothetical protein